MFRKSLSKETIIVSLGMLSDLNHMATGAEFLKLAAQPDKLQAGEKLGPAEIQQALPAVLALDNKLKSNEITADTFRAEVIKILKLQNVSDTEFDKAWNAMLGNVKTIGDKIEALKSLNPDSNFILVSATSSIHLKHIFNTLQSGSYNDDHSGNPLSFLGLPLHVSYLSDAFKLNPINKSLYEEAFKIYKSRADKTIVIINPESNTYDEVKKRDEANAASIKLWAEKLSLTIIERHGKDSVADAISQYRAPAAEAAFVKK